MLKAHTMAFKLYNKRYELLITRLWFLHNDRRGIDQKDAKWSSDRFWCL